MSKNRKNNRKADNKASQNSAVVNIEVTCANNAKVLVASFNYLRNQFYCPCGHRMFWAGGRYDGTRTMEVLKCEHCGRSTDPRMVVDVAVRAVEQWEARKAAYKAQCEMNFAIADTVARLADATVEHGFFARLGDQVAGLWRSIPATALSIL